MSKTFSVRLTDKEHHEFSKQASKAFDGNMTKMIRAAVWLLIGENSGKEKKELQKKG